MRYWVGPVGPGESGTETTVEVFEQVKNAWNATLALSGVEEKFKIVLDNYVEYERELLDITLRGMLFSRFTWSETTDDIYTLNCRLANLLMASRLYVDQCRHDVSGLHGQDSEAFAAVVSATKRNYDSSLAYRVMDSLRNYSQHAGLPISGLKVGGAGTTREASTRRVKWTIEALIKPAELATSGGIKAQVVSELVALGEEVNLTPLVREYVACLASVHSSFRTVTHSDLAECCSMVRETVQQHGATRWRAARVWTADGESEPMADVTTVFTDVVDRLDLLVAKNSRFESTPIHFVSGEA